jgi:UDP-N-acetylglucosamine acyltransferase
MKIHETSIIHPSSKIDDSVEIGPYCIIGEDVEIKEGTKLLSHVVLRGPTFIGTNNIFYQFSTIGEDTPDKKFKGEKTKLEIGNNNIFREGVTVHRGTIQDKELQRLVLIIYLWHIVILLMIASLVIIMFLQIMLVLQVT